MLVAGVGYSFVCPVMVLLGAPGWIWGEHHRMPVFEYMLLAIYVPLGFFLIRGAWDAMRYRPLVNYVIVSNLIHATVMLYSAVADHEESEHLLPAGDVFGTYAAALVLIAGHPTAGVLACLHRRRDRRLMAG
ncbi:DUF6632 domain-containing protein [Streptomyces sp. NPDC056480]|uniref:DUF6632 domain-containing protein n=1 Tax=Streptomyces sp. NPDC056480 TaxID=3345833 RepID=UPI003680743A